MHTIAKKGNLEHAYSLYDIVIASASIEHLPRAGDILFCLLSLLKRDGIFYTRTPWVVPLMRLFRFFRVKWDLMYPMHLYDLGQDFWESYFKHFADFEVLESRPSIVETTFKKCPLRTIFAYIFKAPWYLLGRRYRLVGSWEVLVRKISDEACGGRSISQKHLLRIYEKNRFNSN